jgi:hypothetical protein
MSLKSPNPTLDKGDVYFFEEYGVLAAIAFAVGVIAISMQ